MGKHFLKETFPCTRLVGSWTQSPGHSADTNSSCLWCRALQVPDGKDVLPFHPKTLWQASGNQQVSEMLKTRPGAKAEMEVVTLPMTPRWGPAASGCAMGQALLAPAPLANGPLRLERGFMGLSLPGTAGDPKGLVFACTLPHCRGLEILAAWLVMQQTPGAGQWPQGHVPSNIPAERL